MGFTAESLWTYNGNQYAVFIDSSGNVIAAKRSLPDGSWETADTGLNVGTDDLHRTANLGIDPDGYIHIIAGLHNNPLSNHYVVSTNPEDITSWTFKTQMTGANEDSVTYPSFFTDGNYLYCHYRNGEAGDGEIYLNKYDHTTKTWTALHHPWINPVADTRSPYIDAVVVDSNGHLHVSWCWRRLFNGEWTNEKVCYAKSEDGGATWKKSDGTVYTVPITFADSEVVDSVGEGGGLLNSNDMGVDSNNRPHIVYYKGDINGFFNYFHAWFDGSSWHINQITTFEKDKLTNWTYAGLVCPLPLCRPSIVLSGTDAIVLFTHPVGNGIICAAKASHPYTSWSFHKLGNDTWGMAELNFDRIYWETTSKLHIFVSNPDGQAGSTPVYVLETTPSNWAYSYSLDELFGESNGDNTFIFFDDFLGNTLDTEKWVVRQGSVSVANSELKLTGTTGTRGVIDGLTPFSIGAAVHSRVRWSSAQAIDNHFCSAIEKSGDVNYVAADLFGESADNQVKFLTRDAGVGTETRYLTVSTPTSYHIYKVTWKSGESKAYQDDTLLATHTTNIPTVDQVARFAEGKVSGQDVYVNWVFTRKYVDPEPTHGAWGAEESL